MRIGSLDRKVTLETNSESKNTRTGEVTESWTKIADVWAKREDEGGSEDEEAEQHKAIHTVNYIIRHRTDVDEGDSVVYNGNRYDIRAVSEMGRRRFLRLETERRT